MQVLNEGERVAFDGLASAAMRLLAWHDRDDDFVTIAAEECAESGLTSVQFERELWEALRAALALEGEAALPDPAAVYERRRLEARGAAIRDGGVDTGGDLVSVRPRTPPAFAAGNFAQRLREAIEICALAIDDRRKLIVETPARIVEALEGEADWQPVPACFKGDARIVGSFNGVPVRQEFNTSGALIVLAGEIVGVIYAGDQTPAESEQRGEAERGA